MRCITTSLKVTVLVGSSSMQSSSPWRLNDSMADCLFLFICSLSSHSASHSQGLYIIYIVLNTSLTRGSLWAVLQHKLWLFVLLLRHIVVWDFLNNREGRGRLVTEITICTSRRFPAWFWYIIQFNSIQFNSITIHFSTGKAWEHHKACKNWLAPVLLQAVGLWYLKKRITGKRC